MAWPCRIAISILFGTATTIAISWAFALKPNPNLLIASSGLALSNAWNGRVFEFSGSTYVWMHSFSLNEFGDESVVPPIEETQSSTTTLDDRWSEVPWSWAHTRSPAQCDQAFANGKSSLSLDEHATGWPMLAMVGRTVTAWDDATPSNQARELTDRFWRISRPRRGDSINLPIEPIPLGFVTNTALSAAVWLALLSAPSALVRRFRRRAGTCAKCNYSLAGLLSPACPECGTPHPAGTSTISRSDRITPP